MMDMALHRPTSGHTATSYVGDVEALGDVGIRNTSDFLMFSECSHVCFVTFSGLLASSRTEEVEVDGISEPPVGNDFWRCGCK